MNNMRRAVTQLLAALVAVVLTLPCTAAPAWAASSEGLLDTSNESAVDAPAATSSQLSDDGEDYGWLYRQDDCLYQMSDGEKVLVYKDGYWYPIGVPVRNDETIYSSLYPDGTMLIHQGNEVCLDALILSGEDGWALVKASGNWFECNDEQYPRIPLLHAYDSNGEHFSETAITRLVVHANVQGHWNSHKKDLSGAFEGYANLIEAEGLQYLPTSQAVSMARMFAGCSSLQQLDLSGFDSSACTDFSGMFDGCTSLTSLVFGDGWTQRGVGGASDAADDTDAADATDAADDESAREGFATFPQDMVGMLAGKQVCFSAGEVIPDGPGIYTKANATDFLEVVRRAHIREATVFVGSGDDICDVTAGERFVCAYTGSAVEPPVMVAIDGRLLDEGVDYDLSFANNVEDGTASLTLAGKGVYYGTQTKTFVIEDRDAYAFLYDDGLLYLTAGHHSPSVKVLGYARPLALSACWLKEDGSLCGADVPWKAQADMVKRVVFDASLAAFSPKSAAHWFEGCTALAEVEGLQYLDTTRLASMAEMFAGCSSLVELDLSGLAPSEALTDVSGLVSGCERLELLDLGGLDARNLVSSEGFAAGTPSLKQLVTGPAWHNAHETSAQLVLPAECYLTEPSYKRIAGGSALADGAATYRISDLALQFGTVEMKTGTYTCTGKAIQPQMTVKLGDLVLREGVDYTVSYANNVYPGSAKATIMGKGCLSGGLIVPFTIEARVTHVGDRLVYTDGYATYTLKVTKVSSGGKVAEAALVKVSVTKSSTKTLTLPNQCTVGGTKVTVTSVSSKLTGNFRNVSSVVVGAKVTSIGSRAFANAKKVKTVVIKSARLKSVKKCLSGSKVTKVKTKVKLSSKVKKKYKGWFTKKSVVGKSVSYSYG